MEKRGPFGILPVGPVRKALSGQEKISDDIFLDIIWALQDIAIIRALANFKENPQAASLIYKYFNLLLHDLLTNDLPRHGMKMEDVNEVKNLVEKARTFPIGSNEFDSNLAGADGAFCRFLEEYSQKYYKLHE